MSILQPPAPGRRPSATGELATNNPFRARLSGVPYQAQINQEHLSYGTEQRRERPKSRNPFLDVFADEVDDDFSTSSGQQQRVRSSSFSSPQNNTQLTGAAAELFENLTISDNSTNMPSNDPAKKHLRPRPPPPHHERRASEEPPLISVSTWGPSGDNGRQGSSSRRPPPPPVSRREADRQRSKGPPPVARRPRRNSDSSVIDAHEAEAHRNRDRSERTHARHGSSKSRSKRDASSDKRKKNSALDVIDKLDVTGIYGSGLFHHDGPFDACNPHRNKSSRRLAPVQAFPADSANNSMTGFGPLPEKADHSHVFGSREEAFNDYTTSGRPSAKRSTSFDPKQAIEIQHGDESLGLGTSTFLDGAPASRVAKQKNMEEQEEPTGSGGGLQRKKSLAQKIRSIGDPGAGRRRAPPPPTRKISADNRNSPVTPHETRGNPFFNDSYDGGYDRKGENITVADRHPTSPSNRHPGIQRVSTDDGTGSGLLQRVRSLSKSKRRND